MGRIGVFCGVLVFGVAGSIAVGQPAGRVRAGASPTPAAEVGFVDAEGTSSTAASSATTLTLETDVERIVRKAEATAGPVEAPKVLQDALTTAGRGSTVLMNGLDMEGLPILPVALYAEGPPMIFADDPEYIRVPEGAVLRERVNAGVTRLYLYHVNGLSTTSRELRKITAVIENLSEKPMRLRFLRRAFPGVSLDYGRLGREGIRQFLEATPEPDSAARVIGPHEAVPLDPDVDARTVKPDELVHGWYEFEVDQPAQVTVLQTDPATPGPVAAARIKTLLPPRSKSGAGRGYYQHSGYLVADAPGRAYDTAQGAQQVMIADGLRDRWMTGFDSSSSTMPCVLKGNYGVVYRLNLKRTASDGRNLAVMTWNARTLSGCKAMSGAVQVGPGLLQQGTVMVPSDTPLLRGGDKAVLLQVYGPPGPGEPADIELIYTPPGASCLPTPILLVPFGPVKAGSGAAARGAAMRGAGTAGAGAAAGAGI